MKWVSAALSFPNWQVLGGQLHKWYYTMPGILFHFLIILKYLDQKRKPPFYYIFKFLELGDLFRLCVYGPQKLFFSSKEYE